tara:strand:- start:1570 stop:2220 length:651 start_codon:yes stop_codon:yes gene_type:complete
MHIIKIKKNSEIEPQKKNNLNFLDNCDLIHTWEIKSSKYSLYGNIDGKAGCENKFDLPPPIDSNLYFNDLFLIKYNNSNEVIDLTLEDFNDFYSTLFNGFYDLENDDEIDFSETLSEHSSDRDFINDEELDYSDISENIEPILSDISISDETSDVSVNELSDYDDDIENDIQDLSADNIKTSSIKDNFTASNDSLDVSSIEFEFSDSDSDSDNKKL